jgi:hypothetical protein
VDPVAALGLYLGRADAPGEARTIEVGAPADLCTLAVSWRDLNRTPQEAMVQHTIIAGELA